MSNGPKGESESDRRWPLRVGLALALVALVVSGLSLSRPGARVLPTTTATPTTSVTTTSPAATTTTTVLAPGLEPGSTMGPLASFPALRHCGFHETNPPSPAPATSVAHPSSATSSTTLGPVRTLPLGHCRILEIGDSIGSELGWGLGREIFTAPGIELIQRDKSSTGLAATWFYNWPAHLRGLLHTYRPNLVIVCLGANDQQAMSRRGSAMNFATSPWRAAYRGNIDQILGLARHAGAYVLWVGLPVMRPSQYNRGVTLLNSLYAERVSRSPGAIFVATSRLLATPSGEFRQTAHVGSRVEILRASDGIHFTVIGEDIFATYVAKALSATLHVNLPLSAPMGING